MFSRILALTLTLAWVSDLALSPDGRRNVFVEQRSEEKDPPDDERVPAEHSRGLYRALQHYLHVPTALVVYPGAGHSLTTYAHRKAKRFWDLQWFDHHVLGKPGAEME